MFGTKHELIQLGRLQAYKYADYLREWRLLLEMQLIFAARLQAASRIDIVYPLN